MYLTKLYYAFFIRWTLYYFYFILCKGGIVLNYKRVQQIIDSQELVQVTYHGIPVYIQSLDSTHIATVFPLDNIDDLQSVDIDGLLE